MVDSLMGKILNRQVVGRFVHMPRISGCPSCPPRHIFNAHIVSFHQVRSSQPRACHHKVNVIVGDNRQNGAAQTA